VEEWIARDELGLILQLGFDPWKAAAAAVRRSAPVVPTEGKPIGAPEAAAATATGSGTGEFVSQWLLNIWNGRALNVIDEHCVPNYRFHGPTGRELYGRGSVKAFVLSMLAAFPDLTITTDHSYQSGNDRDGYRVMTRWTLHGTHNGPGVYGLPTGRRIRLLAISHHHVIDRRCVEEWTVFDEFVLLKQLYTPEIHGAVEEE